MTFMTIKLRLHWVFLNDINSCPKFHATNSTVVDQNKIGQSVTLDSFTIQRFV
jgi:hypothetical protein